MAVVSIRGTRMPPAEEEASSTITGSMMGIIHTTCGGAGGQDHRAASANFFMVFSFWNGLVRSLVFGWACG